MVAEFVFESDCSWPQELPVPRPNPAVAEPNIVAAAFANRNHLAGLRPFLRVGILDPDIRADWQSVERFRLRVEPFSDLLLEDLLLLFSLRFLQLLLRTDELAKGWLRLR